MRYGVLVNVNTDNIGDDIQSYAQLRFLPSVDDIIDRESLDTFGIAEKVSEPVSVIMNGWYMERKYNWPPSPLIRPLFVSMHISPNDYFNIGDRFLDGLGGDYLRQYAPIGARDDSTVALLQRKGIEAYLSGCLTLTLRLPGERKPGDEVILADVDAEIEDTLRRMAPDANFVTITHRVDPAEYRTRSIRERFSAVESLLERYRGARCVITERLHCALPCLALGTPVLLVYRNEYLGRMGTFLPFLHTATWEDALAVKISFDLASPPENPNAYLPCRQALEEACQRFIQNSEQGTLLHPAEMAWDEVLVWQKSLLDPAGFTFRKTIDEQQDWIRSLSQANCWNREQREALQRQVTEIKSWNGELEKSKAYFLDQIRQKEARIAELEGWTAQLGEAKAYLEEQGEHKDARIAELEGWTAQLEEGKTYLEEQREHKDARIAELEKWTAQLCETRAYLEEQGKQKDARIAELEGWTAQLCEAKAYLEGQDKHKDSRIAELEKWTIELEKAKEWFLSEIADREAQIAALKEQVSKQGEECLKLRQALRSEIEKPWHQKLLHGSTESDYGLAGEEK